MVSALMHALGIGGDGTNGGNALGGVAAAEVWSSGTLNVTGDTEQGALNLTGTGRGGTGGIGSGGAGQGGGAYVQMDSGGQIRSPTA